MAGGKRWCQRNKALVRSTELLCMMVYGFYTIKYYIRRVLRTRDLGKWIWTLKFENTSRYVTLPSTMAHRRCSWQYWHPSARKSTAAHPSGECSSCQCLSASALLVVFPVACPYSSLFVTAFRSRRIVVCMYRDWHVLQNSPRGLLWTVCESR